MQTSHESTDAAIRRTCEMAQSMMSSGDRSIGALASLEAVCKSIGLLCATAKEPSAVASDGFLIQHRILDWIHGNA